MDVSSTIKALRQRCSSFGGRVFGLAQMAAKDLETINPEEHPSAYVACIREDAMDVTVTENSYRQEVSATVAVYILVANQDDRAQTSAAEAEQLKEEIFKAILGWAPSDDHNSIYIYEDMQIFVNNRAFLGIQLNFSIIYALGPDDTRIPDQQAEDFGNFDTLNMSVDKIETPPGAPDGREDARVVIEHLYGDSETSESENS